MVILTDGKSYRISIISQGHSGLTNGDLCKTLLNG